MTPREKAIELYTKYETLCKDFTRGVSIKEFAKESALVAIGEMIEATNMYQFRMDHQSSKIVPHPYWQEVKQELEKL